MLERLSDLLQDEYDGFSFGVNPWFNENEEIERLWNGIEEHMDRWAQTGQFPRDELAIYAELKTGMYTYMRGGNLAVNSSRVAADRSGGHEPTPGEVVAGVAIGAAGVALAGIGALRMLGFGAQGPGAGTFASRAQSRQGDVPAGSPFARAQSAGMRAPNTGGGLALSLGLGAIAFGVSLATGRSPLGSGDERNGSTRRRM
ncbi:hypothetical protein FRC02_000223 [Tulasnella sp. 418]|nr:hypothetical protein FRC02_000223 [Tulasnella sp. 418]